MAFLSRHLAIVICLLCIMAPVPFWLLGQIELIYRIVLIYFLAGSVLWGSLFFSVAIKHGQRERRQKLPKSERLSPLYRLIGILILAWPMVIIGFNRIWDLWGNNLLARTGVFYVDLFKLAFAYVLLVFLLFLEFLGTAILIRLLLKIDRLPSSEENSDNRGENTA